MASSAVPQTTGTIKAEEAAHFGQHAADWWNPKGSSAMLHKLNPIRLAYIRQAVNEHWGLDEKSLHPLIGKRALDVGCGAGLLCEPLARLGAQVTGLDAAPENAAVAQAHAAGQGLPIRYEARGVETLDEAPFDLVTSMEVIEHVADPALFIRSLARMLKDDGVMILSTPNRTPASKLAMITVGEGCGMIPKGTHDWASFLTPEELTALLDQAGLKVRHMQGIDFTPAKGLALSDNMAINYILTVTKA